MNTEDIIEKYKREGYFDNKRRELFEKFTSNNENSEKLSKLLEKVIKIKISKDPDIIFKNNGKISAIIQTELVKRHISKKNSDNNNNNNKIINSMKENINKSEESDLLELFDEINSILDEYANSVEIVNTDELKELK
ncbi:hypothetical protein DAPK24_026620 [Pichia kluyveri]|uniref:BOD1/SHG1 domain-containing protein n=1 Tax=Pichia kluyveri TaxID=36015 RepID=A0AAV5R542_PICKL|nr:hypothetical protein DAPK24_026620 [Pichia kluyveri]